MTATRPRKDAVRRTRALRSGLTLVEVLVALALAVLVALAAARALHGTRRVDRAVGAASDALLSIDLAAGLVRSEVRRSGYAPFPRPSGLGWTEGATDLVLTKRAADGRGDVLRVRYVDDRLAIAPVVRDLRFDAAVDARGTPQLYRTTAAGARQPLVEGIAAVRIAGWADAHGLHGADALRAGALEPWALLLTLTARDGRERTLAVALPSRPVTEVVVVP